MARCSISIRITLEILIRVFCVARYEKKEVFARARSLPILFFISVFIFPIPRFFQISGYPNQKSFPFPLFPQFNTENFSNSFRFLRDWKNHCTNVLEFVFLSVKEFNLYAENDQKRFEISDKLSQFLTNHESSDLKHNLKNGI